MTTPAFTFTWLRAGVCLALAILRAWAAPSNEPSAAAPPANGSEPAARAGLDVEGRKREQAWLWQTPQAPRVPAVRQTAWPKSSLDYFVLQRLEERGLSPAAPADDRTWLRRVHFALTGLPPGLDDLREFLGDTSPAGRERVVDRLLASPHFGERWARHWMDLVRYAETRGHEGDYGIANAWQYRDYLIRAFNADVPYDQFLREHLAGDLVEPPRLRPGTDINESVLGTGWAFLGEENHSPVDIRQDECDRLDNKLDVFTKTFLGLTVSCARCHDHKFDPIRTDDYYALTGFLLGSSYRQVRFEAMENNRRMAGELRAVRSKHLPQLAARLAEASAAGLREVPAYLVAARAQAEGATSAEAGKLDPARLRGWTDQWRMALTNEAHPLHAAVRSVTGATQSAAAPDPGSGRAPALPAGARVVADFTRPGVQPWKVDGEAFGDGPQAAGSLAAGNDPDRPLAGVMRYGAARRDPFWNRLSAPADNENDSGRLAATARSGRMLRTPTITLEAGKLHYLIRGRTRVYAAVDSHLMVEGPLHGRLVQTFDSGTNGGPRWVTHDLTDYRGHRTHVEFGPEGESDLEVLMVVESEEAPAWTPRTAFWAGSDSFRSVEELAVAFQARLTEAADALGRAATGTVPGELAVAADWLVRNAGLLGAETDPAWRLAAGEYGAAVAGVARRVRWESRTAIAWFDGTGVDEHVLVRGKPFKPGPLAPRRLPAAFASVREITPADRSGRLELAAQLADPANPLVARVLVNRVWHHLFGRGIVASVDNFGALGDRPTHPELLDHVAWQFAHADGWSLKRLMKRLVLSQTFAQGHRAAEARAAEIDPANLLWHRMPVRRLEAEAIRDAVLAVSGRLNPAVGGPPVPVHLTEFVVGRGRPDRSGPLDGDGRRSLYTAARRNFLPTAMLTFDSPTPFSTVGRRNVTNVPGQALARMNDPFFHQQAEVWAGRLRRETPGADDAQRIAWLFETGYGRLPTPAETATCRESLAELRRFHSGEGAERSELAGWADLCHALLNANDFIYVF